jgi:steroid delta-isomerase-like uncharacterized protein
MGRRIDVVLEHLAVENQHDMEAMLATLSGENSVRDEVAGQCYQGRRDVSARYAELWKAFPDFTVVARRLVEEGDSVVMLADYSGTHLGQYGNFKPTGKTFKVRIVNIIDFIGDKICRETIFMDSAGQLRQLGLLPAAGPR